MNWKKIKNVLELLISHHIDNGCFEDHVLHIGKLRICAGCTFFVLGILLSFFFIGPAFYFISNNYVWLFFGGFLLLFCYLVSVFKYEKWYNRLGKFLAGFGLMFYIFGGMRTVLMPLIALSIPISAFIYSNQLLKNHKQIYLECRKYNKK